MESEMGKHMQAAMDYLADAEDAYRDLLSGESPERARIDMDYSLAVAQTHAALAACEESPRVTVKGVIS